MPRLVSGYYQKFIKLAKHGTWAPKIKMIIENYRDRPNTGDQVHPTPEEFIRYILDRLRANRRQTDPHWRPQHLQVNKEANLTTLLRLSLMYKD